MAIYELLGLRWGFMLQTHLASKNEASVRFIALFISKMAYIRKTIKNVE